MFFENQYIPTIDQEDLLFVQPDFNDFTEVLELETQRLKWNNFIESHPNIWDDSSLWTSKQSKKNITKKIFQIFDAKVKIQKQLKRLIRGGIPPELRGKVWWSCSGAADKMTQSEDQYQDYLKRFHELKASTSSILRDIEKDLLRTFPDRLGRSYDSLVSPKSEKCLESLKRVLMAYAIRNPSIGYCQSMNYIAALLLFHMNEEMAFWCMVCMIEDYLPMNYYAPSLIGGRVDQQVFQTCIAWKLPKLYAIFKATNTMLEPIICPWFLCLYINVLPLYAVCRVWDCLFWEGSMVLFRIGLSLMRSKLKYISEANDFIEIYSLLKISNNSTHSFRLEPYRNSHSSTSSSSSSSNQQQQQQQQHKQDQQSNNSINTDPNNKVMSDSEFLIKSSFGYKWLRFIPSQKIEILRNNFYCLLTKDRPSSTVVNPNPSHNPSYSSDNDDNQHQQRTRITRSTSSGKIFTNMFTFSSPVATGSKSLGNNETSYKADPKSSQVTLTSQQKVVIENPLKALNNNSSSYNNNNHLISPRMSTDSISNKKHYLMSLDSISMGPTELFAFARELDEGLSFHVEGYARELLDADEIRDLSVASNISRSSTSFMSGSLRGVNSNTVGPFVSGGSGGVGIAGGRLYRSEWISDIEEDYISDCPDD